MTAGSFDDAVDFPAPSHRDRATVHTAVDPPLCDECRKLELSFFDPNCPHCNELLMDATTTVPEIFAILRQWTPQTQQSLELLVSQVCVSGGISFCATSLKVWSKAKLLSWPEYPLMNKWIFCLKNKKLYKNCLNCFPVFCPVISLVYSFVVCTV